MTTFSKDKIAYIVLKTISPALLLYLDKTLKGLESNHMNLLLSFDTRTVLKIQPDSHCTDMLP